MIELMNACSPSGNPNGNSPVMKPSIASVTRLVRNSDSLIVNIDTAAVIPDSNADLNSVSMSWEWAMGSNIHTQMINDVVTPLVRPKTPSSALGTDCNKVSSKTAIQHRTQRASRWGATLIQFSS